MMTVLWLLLAFVAGVGATKAHEKIKKKPPVATPKSGGGPGAPPPPPPNPDDPGG